MKKFVFLTAICTFLAVACARQGTEVSLQYYATPHPYEIVQVDMPAVDNAVRNVILMIGDGMGLEQVSCAWVLNRGKLNLDNFPYIGLSRTYCTDYLITDSGAGGTAWAAGVKTAESHVGTAADNTDLPSILVKARKLGKKTGVAVTCHFADATPCDFCCHNADRYNQDDLIADYVDCGVDYLSGGGLDWFTVNRKDGRDITREMAAAGYHVALTEEELLQAGLPVIGILAPDNLPVAMERGDLYRHTVARGLDILSRESGEKGFVMMLEGSCIDDWLQPGGGDHRRTLCQREPQRHRRSGLCLGPRLRPLYRYPRECRLGPAPCLVCTIRLLFIMTQKKNTWLLYALITMVTWGIWGAFSDQTTLPKTLVYVVWALSMIPCALVALANIKFKLDMRSKPALLSMGVGLLGAGGQLVLFLALDYAPAYLVMPMISVAPIVTVILSAVFLKEKVSRLGLVGIALAFVALVCFALPDNTDGAAKSWIWIVYASVVFISWGIQAFVMKLANNSTPDAESVFVYMAISAVILIPVALLMGKNEPSLCSFGWAEPLKVFGVQILNAIGAFTLVYANRYGKAMIVAPLADACAPVIMCVISLILYAAFPTVPQLIGMVAAISCVFIFSRE